MDRPSPPTRQMRLTLLTTDQGGAVAKGYSLEPVGAEAPLYLRAVRLGPGLLTVRFRNILVIQLKKCTILTCQCSKMAVKKVILLTDGAVFRRKLKCHNHS